MNAAMLPVHVQQEFSYMSEHGHNVNIRTGPSFSFTICCQMSLLLVCKMIFFWPHRQILNECFGRHCLISVPLFPLFCVRRTFLPFTPDMGSSHTFHIFAFPHFHVSKFLSVSGFSYWLAPHIYAKFINTGHFHFGN